MAWGGGGIIGNPTLRHYYRWTWLQRVMLSSHLLPHFYSYSTHCKQQRSCEANDQEKGQFPIHSTFVTDDVEACKFFFLLFQVVPHAHFSTLVIYEMATLAGNGTIQKISRQLIASMELYGYMDGRQQAGTEQALFKPNQTRPALRSITMNEVSVLGISLSTQKVGVLQKNISPKQVTLTQHQNIQRHSSWGTMRNEFRSLQKINKCSQRLIFYLYRVSFFVLVKKLNF